mmetsp:Transcript_7369/g.29601  ORF Transcript_7369/g.29601 Transcript_7369/m.29601 type:complete len:253 (+) Transcript_7369:1292-2050(+)
MALIKSFGDIPSPFAKKLLASRSFGEKTSPMETRFSKSFLDSGASACVNGSIEIKPHPPSRSACTSSTSGRDGFKPKCTAFARLHFSGQIAYFGRNIAYKASLASNLHTCVRRPSRSVICHARGVDVPNVNKNASAPMSASHLAHVSGQSPSPTPATRPSVSSPSDVTAAPNSVCGPPPPSTAIRVVPSANTRSSTMSVVERKSIRSSRTARVRARRARLADVDGRAVDGRAVAAARMSRRRLTRPSTPTLE